MIITGGRVSFLSKLFGGKDAPHYLEQGNRYFVDGRFSDARHAYMDALEKLGTDDAALRVELDRKLGETGDALAGINLTEAEWCFTAGDTVKARDHLELAAELAVAPEMKQRVELCLQRCAAPATTALTNDASEGASCSCSGGSCAPPAAPDEQSIVLSDEHLSSEERFELLTAALPDDLPKRYRALGDRFREGYLLAHSGSEAAAVKLLQSLDIPAARDIILYELALICHNAEDLAQCESLLRQALALNDRNVLCYLALVDLCTGTGRYDEALALLGTMTEHNLQPAQAQMIRGDILEHLGQDEPALESYAGLLGGIHKKEAATRIIPILERLGRVAEARQVFAQYVKGCC